MDLQREAPKDTSSTTVSLLPQSHSSTSVAYRNLPQELWDMTALYLKEDLKSLKACSLTSEALRQASRKLFWRSLSLRSSAGLESLLSKHPDVAVFVQKLSVYLPLAKIQLLLKFKNLKSLRWSNESEGEDVLDDTTPFLQCVAFPGVTDLFLSWYDDLQDVSRLGLLACFPGINTLRIEGPSFIFGKKVDDDCKEVLQAISLSLPHLQYLYFSYARLTPTFSQIMHATGNSLKFVKVDIQEKFDETTAELLGISHATHLTGLEVHLGFLPTSPNWGDTLAMTLQQVKSSHKSLTRILLHVPSLLPDNRTGLQRTWAAPGERLGQQLSRVMKDVPSVTVTFYQAGSLSTWAANHAHGTLGYNLQNDFPDLTAFRKRLRFKWNVKVWSKEDGPSHVHNEALIQAWQL